MKESIDGEKKRTSSMETRMSKLVQQVQDVQDAKTKILTSLQQKEKEGIVKMDNAMFRIGTLEERQAELKDGIERVINNTFNLDQSFLESKNQVNSCVMSSFIARVKVPFQMHELCVCNAMKIKRQVFVS